MKGLVVKKLNLFLRQVLPTGKQLRRKSEHKNFIFPTRMILLKEEIEIVKEIYL